MSEMRMHASGFEVRTERGPDVVDITLHVRAILQESGIQEGIVELFAVGSTASLTSIEFEEGAVKDLKDAIERLAPRDGHYAHEEAWHDGNGHSHVQAALMGPALTVPVRDGAMSLGQWQQIVLVNHDDRNRQRHVDVTILGR